MANVNNIKFGTYAPQTILLDKYYNSVNDFKFNFLEWEINPVHDITVTNNRIVIRKFQPNTWIIRSAPVTGSQHSAICSYCKETYLTVTGITTNQGIFGSLKTLTNNHGAGGDLPRFRGFVIYPMTPDGYWMQERMYTWESCWDTANTRNSPAVADWNTFRLGSGGHGQYGIWTDFTNKLVFPNELYDFPTWGRNPENNSTWHYAIGLYTGSHDDTLIDISDTPIEISQPAINGVDPTNVEVWKMYLGNSLIYKKDRTFENCWKKYGFVNTDSEGNIIENSKGEWPITNNTGINFDNGVNLPPIVDLDKYLIRKDENGNLLSYLSFGLNIKNDKLWKDITDYYSANDITNTEVLNHAFQNLSYTGKLKLNINIKKSDGTPETYLTMLDLIRNSSISGINIEMKDNCRCSVGQNMFRGASNLNSISYKMTSSEYFIPAVDVSGMFEFCNKLKEYPQKLINWEYRASTTPMVGEQTTNISYFMDYAGVTTVPAYPENCTIVCDTGIDQAFNTNSPTAIYPIIDVGMVTGAKNAFMCSKCTHLRIKGLNHMDWGFDGKNGNQGVLTSLDNDSIKYLFDNLTDLTTYDVNKIPTQHNCFMQYNQWWQWNDSKKHDCINAYTIQTSSRDGKVICSTTLRINNFEVNVSGLQANDVLRLGSTQVTTDGNYTINNTEGNQFAISLSGNSSNTQTVIIRGVKESSFRAPKVSSAKLYCPSTWEGYNFSSMTASSGATINNNEVTLTTRVDTSQAAALAYINNSSAVTLNIKVEGLIEGDVLGIGNGSYSAIQNKITQNGTYQITFGSGITWGFKLWNNTNTSNTSSVKITSIGAITNEMVSAANAKGWTIYIGGTEKIV